MNRTLERSTSKNVQTPKRTNQSRVQAVSSFDEIPDFNDGIAERLYWKTHRVGKDLLDQVPDIEEDEG
jgi:hypothetical protein